uniref:Calponin-homology (CH) domain-containing protein n=1 Tax=Arcella intermedia TaxID=1963864 RepID=A0A6B2LI63_9EUKA
MQLGALVGWINYQLSSANHSISDINALGDGVTIVKLVEALLFESPPNVISPISTSKDKLDNLSSAINLFNSKTGADIGVSPLILTGNLKALMDLAWDIIYHSSIKTIYYGGFPDRFALLKWAQDNTAHLNIPLINDFVTSFKSGMAFCALISSIHPGLVYLDDLQEYKVMDNLRLAFKLANEVFKVPKLIEPADMLSDPDEITIIIYLSLCYQKFV